MEGSIFNKQRTLQTQDHVLWIMQLARNILMNNEQHL